MLALHDLGGEGQPLLISHATGFTGRSYAPFASGLRRRFHVWAVDHRGHGHSPPPSDGDVSWDSMTSDLLEAVGRISEPGAVAYGHSMGGTVALLAAEARPDLFAAVYVYEPAVLAANLVRQDHIDSFVMGIRHRREIFTSTGDALAYFAARDPYRRFRVDALMAYVTDALEPLGDGTLRLRCAPSVEADCYARQVVTSGRFASLQTPVVIACGSHDSFGAGLVPPPLANALPHVEVRVLDRLGHFGPLEAPEIAAADVIDAVDLESARVADDVDAVREARVVKLRSSSRP